MIATTLSRRNFLRASAAATFGFHILPPSARGANERIHVGCIGIAGKGMSDIIQTAAAGGVIAALCDVADPRNPELVRRRKKTADNTALDRFPDAKIFVDYREMLDAMPGLDAVTVSTPDHHHFHASMLAMRKGKHVYCQKPLSHSVWEARRMAETAAECKVQTQMGNQAHAGEPIRRAVELLRAGVIGRVTEVHAWTNRPTWPQGMTAWPAAEPAPAGIDWDLWIGPAPYREYSKEIAPLKWRGWWDFGVGALGDMGCHIMDMPYWALDLGSPDWVEATHEGGTEIAGPLSSTVTYHFSKNFFGAPIRFVWYDGVAATDGVFRHAPPEHLWKDDFPTPRHVFRRFDAILVGEKGRMFFGHTRQDWVFKPESLTEGFVEPPKTIPRVPGGKIDGRGMDTGGPYVEWLTAIRTGTPALSHFGQSGPFSEVVLLGNIAIRANRRIQWDGAALKAVNAPDAAPLIRRAYRPGWELE